MLKNMRSRNQSGAFCRKHLSPPAEILDRPEVHVRRSSIFQERKIDGNSHLQRKAAIANLSDALYFTNVKRVLSDIVEKR
jgi:hypothetical protein